MVSAVKAATKQGVSEVARKTKEREELKGLSADAQEVFHLIGSKERYSAFIGLTFVQIVEFLPRQRGKVVPEKDMPALENSILDALAELGAAGFVSSEQRNGNVIMFLTDKGDKAFV